MDELVEMYGGPDAVEAALRTAAMKTVDALKATDQLRAALCDVLADWSCMSVTDAARTQVGRLALAYHLEELARELGKTKVELRDAQAAARRDPLRVPDSWDNQRDWYRLVKTFT